MQKSSREKNKITYYIFRYVLGFIFNLYYNPKFINKKAIPKSGPIILSGNHTHLFDQNLACVSTKRMIHYMAKIEYFTNWKTSWFFKAAGCIPVNRDVRDENAKSKAIEVLENGYALGIFPEGTRNKTDKFLLPFKFGVVSMAQKTGATIIPFAVTGKYIFRKGNLNIRYGNPMTVPKDMDLNQANQKLFDEISRLKKEGIEEIENGTLRNR